MSQRPRTKSENDCYTGQNSGIYDKLDFSSLDVAAFTKNSSVYKNQSLSRDVLLEPMSFMEQAEQGGESYRSSSRRMRCLVVLNAVLSVFTIMCLGLTGFLSYKVMVTNEGEKCKGCDGHLTVTGLPSVMPRVELKNLSKSVQNLKRNISFLEEVTAGISTEEKVLHESVKKIADNLTQLREEINKTQQDVINIKQAIAALNSTSLKQGDFLNLWWKLNSTEKDLRGVKEQVINMSNNTPSRGPPGYNGTQGPVGSVGPPGPRGLPGPGNNLKLCRYRTDKSDPESRGSKAKATINVTEKMGTRIIAVHCATNDAKVTRLTGPAIGSNLNQRQNYTCECKGTLNSGDSKMYCYIHYWECPVHS
ncbi:uncharacterized protein LOC144666387 [Oculina patagonica]